MTRALASVSAVFALATWVAPGCDRNTDAGPTEDRRSEIRQACGELAGAWCANAAVCLSARFRADYGDAATCASRRTALCEGTWFGVGSGLKPRDLQRCAAESDLGGSEPDSRCETWLEREVGKSVPDSCRPYGTLGNDARCAVGAQCATRICAMVGPCGYCRKAGKEGEPCFEAGECEPDYACFANACTPFSADVCAKGPCYPDRFCNADKTCHARLHKGDSCDPLAQDAGCARWPEQLVCNKQSKKCEPHAFAQSGELCGLRDADGSFALCDSGLACLPGKMENTGSCVPATEDRAPCGDSSESYPLGGPCRPPALCISGRCQLPSAAGCSQGAPP